MINSTSYADCSSAVAPPAMPDSIVEMVEEFGKSSTAVLLELFIDGVVGQIHHRLPTGSEVIDLASLHVAAHSLKDSAACYGAGSLSKAAALLERACQTTNTSLVCSSIEAVRAECQKSLAEYCSIVSFCRRVETVSPMGQ